MSINVNNGPDADNPLGKDKQVREALELSIDRSVLNQVVLRRHVRPVQTSPRRPAASIGTRRGQPGARRRKGQERSSPPPARRIRSFTLTAANSPVEQQARPQLIQAMAGQAGFQVKIQATEATTDGRQQQCRPLSGRALADLWERPARPRRQSQHLARLRRVPQLGANTASADLDKTLAEARSTTDPDARAKLYAKAGDIYLDDRPALFLYHYKWLWGVSKKVSGFVPYPDGIARLTRVKVAP